MSGKVGISVQGNTIVVYNTTGTPQLVTFKRPGVIEEHSHFVVAPKSERVILEFAVGEVEEADHGMIHMNVPVPKKPARAKPPKKVVPSRPRKAG